MSDTVGILKQARDALGLPPDEPLMDGAVRIRRERDAYIKERDDALRERDAYIKDRDAVLDQRDELLREQSIEAAARRVIAHHRDVLEQEVRDLRIHIEQNDPAFAEKRK